MCVTRCLCARRCPVRSFLCLERLKGKEYRVRGTLFPIDSCCEAGLGHKMCFLQMISNSVKASVLSMSDSVLFVTSHRACFNTYSLEEAKWRAIKTGHLAVLRKRKSLCVVLNGRLCLF